MHSTEPGAVVTPEKDFFFQVDGIHCEACVGKVSRTLEASRLCESYWIDRATNVVRVRKGHVGTSDENFTKELQTLLKKAGYPALQIHDPSMPLRNEWLWQLCFSAMGLAFSYGILSHQSVPFPRTQLLWLLVVVLLFILSIKTFLKGAISSLKAWNFTVDTLVTIGSGAAFLLSMTLILMQIPGHLYWVEAFAILFLVSLGHTLENYVLLKADKTLRSLMVLVPPKAHRVTKSGSEDVLVSELKMGDTILLRPGDRVSVDGKIIEGKSDIDESLLTGESMPLSKGVGDLVFSGTLNLSGNLKFEVQKLGKDMLLSQIIDTVIRVRQTRADIQKFADKISNIFVPVVVGLALLSFFCWYFMPETMLALASNLGGMVHLHPMDYDDFWRAFSAALSVLVISCPCAMGLATPAALMAVSGIAAKKGILIRDGRSIENAEKITHVFFDKTGTLSSAQPKIVAEWIQPSYEAAYLGAVASQSKHPMSKALTLYSAEKSKNTNQFTASIEEFPGEGLKAFIKGASTNVEVLMGNAGLIQRSEVKGLSAAQDFILAELEQGHSLVYWAQNGVLVAIFAFEDVLKEGVAELLKNFSNIAQVRVLSGDNKKVLANIAAKLSLPVEYAIGELNPLDKVNVLQSYQKDGKKVAFIGDGINDAPVLQAADLGIAVSSASDLAKQSADIVLLTKDIHSIFEAFLLARRGMKTIRQNLFWAFAYNVVAIPLAFLGLVSPIVCTLSMAFSDLVIIANSLRVFLSKKVS